MCSDTAEADKPPSEASQRRATWAGLVLEGQQELRGALGLDEVSFLRVAGPSHADCRAYLLYAVLDELLKTSACILRWLKLLEEMEAPEAAAPERFWAESITDEESLRIRKLVEVLTDLICFRRTNEDVYYRHLLLLRRRPC